MDNTMASKYFDASIVEDEFGLNSESIMPFPDEFLPYTSFPQPPLNALPRSSRNGVLSDHDNVELVAPDVTQLQSYPDPEQIPESADVAISSAFPFGFTYEGRHSDLTLVSCDGVYFCVHSEKLFSVSTNGFGFGALFSETLGGIAQVSLTASALNVLLHAIYGLSLAKYAPFLADITSAVEAMNRYGISPTGIITPDSALFQAILQLALGSSIQCYALAASAELEELAVAISPYTLSTSIRDLPEDVVQRMGPQYLMRLVSLHLNRIDALKNLVFPPPAPHPPTDACNFVTQRSLFRAWIMAVAYLCWDSRSDLATTAIEAALRPLSHKLTCSECYECLDKRIRKLVVDWALVKRTI